MPVSEKDYWVGFSVFPGVGGATFKNLLEIFGSAKAAWEASEDALEKILKNKKTKDFVAFREVFDFADYKKRLEKTHVSVITLVDPTYPLSLKAIKNPPFVLYVKALRQAQGKELFNFGDKKTIAVVGTRKITQYGRDVTELFTQTLVHAGCTIISGLAMGVDTVAHQTTLDTSGKTIAVLGCGVDCVYPKENEALYDAIIEKGGAIVSEIPLGMNATMGTFPARNRIVAALSDAVLVTEGTIDSGALITAQFGIDFGKKVFAVPGPITSSLSKGPYTLIEKGAKLVTKPEDIVQELGIKSHELRVANKEKIKGDTEEEQRIIDLLENESMSFDEIVRRIQINSALVGQIISIMEIKGLITSTTSGLFKL